MKRILPIILAGLAVLLSVAFVAVWLSQTYGGKENNVSRQNNFGTQIKSEDDGVTKISAAELNTMLTTKDFTLIDVHIPEQEHIIGTDLFIPYDQILQSDQLPQDKNQKIVLYCQSGNMSASAAKSLVSAGYTNVYDLSGGILSFNKFLAQQQLEEDSATARADFIDIKAYLVSEDNLALLVAQYEELAQINLDFGKSNILLTLDNHRVDLTGYDYRSLATLDEKSAESWQPLGEGIGGHHLAGVLVFERSETPQALVIEGLPVGSVTLPFTDNK